MQEAWGQRRRVRGLLTSGRIQECDVKGYAAADDSAEATADWVAHIPRELTSVKLDSLLWGWNWVGFVELALAGAPIHWAHILWKATIQHAFEEREDRSITSPPSYSTLAAAQDHLHDFLAIGVRGAGVGWSSDSLGSHSVEGDKTARLRGAERIDQSPLPLLDQLLSVDGMSDRDGASTISIAVTQQSGPICDRSSDSLRSHSVERDETTRIRGEGSIDQSPLSLLDQLLSVDGMFDSVGADQTGGADLSGAWSPTALDILAGSSAAAAAAEATQPNSRESPGNSVATKILNSEDEEDESSSE
ncbi:hypothetical protein AXG93_2615s1160 [Marchantia polymorpha subsp. ruderalis]|uniref:Uncharacterized protein n=1 Tax=Marchantia polymorpha subsp. ruderalis TaxID=1480154 RepID=A0A176WE32_MARPO|nr:hypothetical protein AXG93_2615s1160 [Marchantia polymorpha subsp. ruderalis]